VIRRTFSSPPLLLAALLLATACAPKESTTRADEPVATTAAEPAASEDDGAAASGPRRELRLVLTTDEHGWLEAWEDTETNTLHGGLLAFASRLKNDEKIDRENVALLSVGDMWTGPFESSVLEGEPMVKAMNHLGYEAAAVGNHEFDFGVRTLGKRRGESKFPYLAANIIDAGRGAPPPWAEAFTVIDVGGMKLGVVGLANEATPRVTDPSHVVGLEFRPYEEALRKAVPAARAAGAEEIVVLIHARVSKALRLLPVLRELDVHIVGAGHAHGAGLNVDDGSKLGDPSDDVIICNGGAYIRSYCRIDVAFQGGELVDRQASLQPVQRKVGEEVADKDPELVRIIADAKKRSAKLGGEVLARSPRGIKRKGEALGQFIVDSWLEALPYADVAITNAGGIRQDLPRGKVRVKDVISVLPFNNYLLVVEMTGAQLDEALGNTESIAAGVRFTYRPDGERRRVEELARLDGTVIKPEDRVKVIVNDFMYRGGDAYALRSYDPEPEETALDWREPVYRRLRALGAEKKPVSYKADDRARLVK
jgi:2',3'-cyclic-nucleotide 2'-phosphodiesterase/3'-nucleotidase